MIRRATTFGLLLILAACGAASKHGAGSTGKAIDDVHAGDFHFGAMAVGQAKDVDYARAEGLGIVPTSPLDAYLNGILAKLVAQSPVRNVPARVYVRASGDWAAKTTADANIYVALGTLLRLDNEDEIAALLAHEASHVILGHADADIVVDVQQRGLQLSALAFETRDLVQGGGRPGTATKGAADRARTQEQTQALLLNTMLITPAWTREQEQEADLLGADLLVRAGYSPQAILSLLRKQAQFETDRANNPQAQSLDRQISAFGLDVNKETAKQTAKVAKQTGVNDEALGALAGAALGQALDWGSKQAAEAQRSHPKTDERIVEAQAYIAREYPNSGTTVVKVESWEEAKEQDGTVDILENYIAAIQAKGKLSEGDLAAARKLAKAGLSGPTRAHAYPNYVAAAVEIEQGASAQALADYETALAGPEPAGAIYTEAAAVYLQTGKRDKAAAVIESGYQRLQQPPALTVPLIRTYHALGRQSDADRIAAQCAIRWPKMQALCSQEAKGN